jgi:hypothetical protein
MAKRRWAFQFRPFLVGFGIAALAALAFSTFTGLPFWAGLGIAVVALLINGWLAEWEDNQPGGFNNPKND